MKRTRNTRLLTVASFVLLLTMPSIALALENKKQQIFLEHAETLSFDERISADFQLLQGDVRFRHDSARLFCDSAHFYPENNSLHAFGNVHMEQGDSLFLYGAWMFYEGNKRLVKVRENVRLENRDKVTLFTDSLNYDRVQQIGYFFEGGLLVDGTNELSADFGQYNTVTKMANFQDFVRLQHPQFVMTSDQLLYNTTTEVAYVITPAEIVSDSAYIYAVNGWYNTQSEASMLYQRSYVVNQRRRLTADTLDYNRLLGIGKGYGNVVIEDSVQQITLTGQHGYSEELTGFAQLVGRPLLTEHSSTDTLYLHSDTLETSKDSIYNQVRALHNVRFYRFDFQGLADSLFYTTQDSVLHLYGAPILWSEQQQLTGKYMQMYTKNNQPERLYVDQAAMVITKEADSLYNQSSGKNLTAYIDSGEVRRVLIDGNAETVYLPRDDDQTLMGLNRLEGSSIVMDRKDGKIERMVVWPQPKGTFYPMEKIEPTARFLKNFIWWEALRPTSPIDVFRRSAERQ